MKLCLDCQEEKPESEFYLTSGRKGGKTGVPGSYCKLCWKLRNHAVNIKHSYGVSRDWYWDKVKAQDGLCAICFKPDTCGRKLAVDHDHDTDQVRDLLCTFCNTALGSFQDNPEILIKALQYLYRWGKEN